MKLLLYCTRSKPYLLREDIDKDLVFIGTNKNDVVGNTLNGKIVAECDFEVEEIYPFYRDFMCEDIFYEIPNKLDFDDLLKKSCLDNQQLDDYLYGNKGYAIHIKNLHIFDKPRPTNWYGYTDKKGYFCIVEKAPQNMMYCYDEFGNDYILISIHPEWLCKILNGEKTIEVRKKILRGMI